MFARPGAKAPPAGVGGAHEEDCAYFSAKRGDRRRLGRAQGKWHKSRGRGRWGCEAAAAGQQAPPGSVALTELTQLHSLWNAISV
jgi:hypothetical protein